MTRELLYTEALVEAIGELLAEDQRVVLFGANLVGAGPNRSLMAPIQQRYADRSVWPTIAELAKAAKVSVGAPRDADVPALVDEVVRWLDSGDLARHSVIRAAMAHLNLVSIHPFRDGNGRLARTVQSLVLAKEGLLRPELVSIEPYLGRHTREYYAVLEEVQGPAFDPHRDASAWVEFCIEAHVSEATERRRWLEIAFARHGFCERLAHEQGYPERFVIAMDQALFGLPVTNADYRRESGMAGPTATQDLQRLRSDGWLDQEGGGRSVRYVAGGKLKDRWSVSQHR